MKIYITHDNNKLGGYKTIGIEDLTNLNFSLSSICYDCQASTIYAPTVLNYIPQEKVQAFLFHLLKLIKRGGTLHVGGIDSLMVFNSHKKFILSTYDLNRILFDESPQIKNLVLLSDIKDFFIKNNTTVNTIDIDDTECRFTIGVTKNG
jgi:hypothetical protein